ncbi:probable chitinase 10 isoform X2 [Trichoplusia ni]|uniref:Probable chitinase 10 isoform X2 n=1 Tax=Trichoplusia ni TaxID=7111 RepID=A0A7E5WRK7_TRINI|nr:probable chitinase 10 isoform X2 [Trichoplusia ni]
MGHNFILWCAAALALCAYAIASPRASVSFARSAVETIPHHEPIAAPIRASVESIPLRSLRDEGDERLPLRDAVEKRPIALKEPESSYKFVEDAEVISDDDLGGWQRYYGAANYLNNTRNDERLQLGNANLQAMQQTVAGPTARRLVVCYMQSWAAYRAPPLAFTAGLVPKSCTHLHYASATMHPHTYAVIPTNEDYDIIKGGYRIATGLKRRIPGLKVMITVGGEGTDRLFSEMVQEHTSRSMFIESAINFMREHDFDGLDLHWVYPGEKDEREKELLTALLYELREKFSSYGFLLSTVLPPFRYQIEDGYDLSAVSGATDYTILQAWDMTHTKRDEPPSKAVQHSALHRDPGAGQRDQRYDNIEFMVKFILRHGMNAEKLVLGVPTYGRSYTLAPSTLPSPGAAVSGWGEEGPYTQTKGLLAYFEICSAEREGKGSSGVDEAGNSYAVFDNQWITYDTPATVLEKMKYVVTTGLAGAAAWSIDMDDFRGLCGAPFPILSAISTTLNGETIQTDQSTLKIGSCESEVPYLSSDEVSCAHFHFCTGGISYRMTCEDERLYDPSTGFCGHQDVAKCMPGQNLRISVEDAARFLSQAYENDFEWSEPTKEMSANKEPERFISDMDSKKSKQSDKLVVCYMTSWAFYRRGDGKFVPENIDTRLCTHVVYAYASLSPDDLIAKEFDPWADVTNNLYERVTSLRDVKVILGLGGWTDSAGDKYSRLVSSEANRSKFIAKLIPFLRMHNFKGLHLDWNYPVCWQSNCKKGAVSDKPNFAKFVKELSKALHDADMELGVALSGYKEVIESAYDLPTLSSAADFLSTMTYDYHGGWEKSTGHHTPLVPSPKDSLAYYSIEYAIKALISGGADPKKLLLGLSFYGQSYRLADIDGVKGPGSAAAGPGEPGEFTKQPGMLAYYEICYRVKNLRWKTGRQENAGPYTYSDNQWVGYDDPKSVTDKVEWAMRQGLGGVTAWAIDLDDFSNRCCAEPSPLLRAAGRALGRGIPSPPSAACERPPEPVTPSPPTTTTAESDGSIGGGGGGHDHHQHTSTTWPSWNPSTTASTTQTWWPAATTPMTTTTSTTTTKRPTTTTKRPTKKPSTESGGLEGASCNAGEYHAAPGDCEGYLQCEGGAWRKHRCAPGLHWAEKVNRCDWPSFAKCTESASSASTATTTLAPMTSRPPPRPTTTTTTTTTRRPTTSRTTTTTTTTTQRPTKKPTTEEPSESDGPADGMPCVGEQYNSVPGDCNAYLHCDGSVWRQQHCAPGLHWSNVQKHCDWPKYAKCEVPKSTTSAPKPTRPPPRPPTRPPTTTTTKAPESDSPTPDSSCGGSDMHAPASTCDAYLQCVGGRWRKQLCPPGLHWDRRTHRCDWVEFAMCEVGKPSKSSTSTSTTTTTTRRPTTTTTTTTTRRPPTKRPTRPTSTTTKRPIVDEQQVPDKNCNTGTYHAHPKCEKFYVCVNGMLIAQSCAPGLVWRPDRSQCDFPSASSCTDKRQGEPADTTQSQSALMQINEEPPKYCESGTYAQLPSDCTRYLHCLFGKFEEFACSAGLHWNQEKQICDWPKNAKCKRKSGPITTTSTSTTTTTSRPVEIDIETRPQAGHDVHDHSQAHQHGSQHSYPMPSKPLGKPFTGTQPEISPKPALLNSRYKLVCYYTNWSWYRPGIGKYSPEDIDPSLCTHIVYGFAVLGDDGLIKAHDSWSDYDNRFYEKVVEYKRYGIKVSLAIGGWNDSAGDKYSKLVNDPAARARFVTHVVNFLQKYGFDGLDLDWEYPKCWQVDCSQGPDSDKEGFADLVLELSAVLKPKGLLLSAAVSPSKKVIDAGYDVPVLARHLDWIAVMTYDYHGQWDKKTGHVAPLYYHPEDDNTYFNANYTIHYWMQKGAPANKLVMGMPTYGQTFTLGADKDSYQSLSGNKAATGLNAPAYAGGEPGEYTRAKGFLSYYEICDRIRYNGWKVVKDPHQRMGPYAYKDNQWVSFDDVDIIKKKVNFMKSLGLAGGMVWALDLDDFRNRCGQGKHPLINAIKDNLLASGVEEDTIHSDPIYEPPNSIDEDLDDIQVLPVTKPPKPIQITTVKEPVKTTTKRPTTTTTTTTVAAPTVNDEFKVVCYYTNWAWYRPGPGKYTPSDIDPSQCTHIVYAFAVLDTKRLVIKPHDIWLDVENKFYEKVVALKEKGVKVLLGLGGWDDSASDKYSRMVNSPSARRKFVIHALDFIEQYEFDGLDLDWEYPKCWQVNCEKGPSSDKQGFASLVKELRATFKPRGLLLSAAVSGSKRVIDAGYDVPTLSKNLDWISLMTYDYHGQWDKKTGHVSPMYASDSDADKTLNTNFTVHYWIDKGAQREKLILGVPFYGQSFSLEENAGTGLGVPSYAGGEAGDETRARGFLSFYEICDRIRVKGWHISRDPGGRMGPYAYYDDQWVSFDDDFMVRHKAEYVRAMGLGGSMAWSLDLDDFSGRNCGCGKSPLLATLNHVLRGLEEPPRCSLEEIQSENGDTDIDTGISIPEPKPDVEEPEDISVGAPVDETGTDTDTDTGINTDIDTDTDDDISNGGPSIEGTSCTGNVFKADETKCSKYYLCLNGNWMQLECPSPLHWYKNHCDWPEKAHCKTKALLRVSDQELEETQADKPIIGCYFTNWAFYRPGKHSFGPQQVDSSVCTHIIYTWAHLDGASFKLVPGNPELDVENDFYGKITQLRQTGVKVIIGAGGVMDSEARKWGRMVSNPVNRKIFVNSVLKFLRRWNFDGVQIAWQYPGCKQTPCTRSTVDSRERENFADLLSELSATLRPHDLELSAVVAASPEIAAIAYKPHILASELDWVVIAANDYYASSTGKTAYLVPLVSRHNNDVNSLNASLSYWTSVLPPNQVVLGVPAYARSYSLRGAASDTLGAPVSGPGEAGNYTRLPGFLAYYEVAEKLADKQWKESYTPAGTFSSGGGQWASYLSSKDVGSASAAARHFGARGAALWALDLDLKGECSLLNALRRGINEPDLPQETCSPAA